MLFQILALVTMLSLAILLRAVTGTWFHVTAMFALFWGLLLALATVAGFEPAPVASWLIVVSTFAVAMGAPLRISASEARPLDIQVGWFIQYFVLLGGMSPVAAALITQRANGIYIGSTPSVSALVESARLLSLLRYDEVLYTPTSATLMLGLGYAGALVAPFAAHKARGWVSVAYLTLPSLGGFFYAVATTARAPFVILVIVTVGSWCTLTLLRTGGRATLPLRVWFILALSVLSIFAVFAIAAVSRSSGATDIFRSFALYAAGSIPAMDLWLRTAPDPEGLGLGIHTFAGLTQFWLDDLSFGGPRPDFVEIGPGYTTNVYSLFRVLGEDFGVGGALLCYAVLGVGASALLRSAVIRGSSIAACSHAIILSFLLFSQTTTLFTFANVSLGLIVGFGLFTSGVRLSTAGLGGGRGARIESRPDSLGLDKRDGLPVYSAAGGARRVTTGQDGI